jgi:hypothetical protein
MRNIKLYSIILMLFVFVSQLQAELNTDSKTPNDTTAPTITITKLDVNDTYLTLSYEIKNDSDADIWICEDITVYQYDYDFEISLDEENRTLLIRRRLSVPALGGSPNAPSGRYVRLQADQVRTESLLLQLPVQSRRVFLGGLQINEVTYANQLTFELGYYLGDMPRMIFSMFEDTEKMPKKKLAISPKLFGKLWYFNQSLEYVNREEEVIIPWTGDTFKGEKISRVTIDGLRIPFKQVYGFPKVTLPDLNDCDHVLIRFQPSMLEYFFPYQNQQFLLSPAEKQYLQSQNTIVSDDKTLIKTFIEEINKYAPGGIITERSTAHVICYFEDEQLTSFTIHDDRAIVTEGKQRLRYKMGLQSLKELTLQVIPFELRIQCATNLVNLWYRFHLYEIASKSVRIGLFRKHEKLPYPSSNTWCDSIERTYRSFGYFKTTIPKPFICPSAGEGKCHYAMNPNCKYDSPGEMVLLFETKAGWNQHGGPEMFTFGNHDPKGGSVLLNDGTVKFIRTEEEIKALRWK